MFPLHLKFPLHLSQPVFYIVVTDRFTPLFSKHSRQTSTAFQNSATNPYSSTTLAVHRDTANQVHIFTEKLGSLEKMKVSFQV